MRGDAMRGEAMRGTDGGRAPRRQSSSSPPHTLSSATRSLSPRSASLPFVSFLSVHKPRSCFVFGLLLCRMQAAFQMLTLPIVSARLTSFLTQLASTQAKTLLAMVSEIKADVSLAQQLGWKITEHHRSCVVLSGLRVTQHIGMRRERRQRKR
eukprot:2597521-Rhodomonas_salina.1